MTQLIFLNIMNYCKIKPIIYFLHSLFPITYYFIVIHLSCSRYSVLYVISVVCNCNESFLSCTRRNITKMTTISIIIIINIITLRSSNKSQSLQSLDTSILSFYCFIPFLYWNISNCQNCQILNSWKSHFLNYILIIEAFIFITFFQPTIHNFQDIPY